jgi:hypothetical protein
VVWNVLINSVKRKSNPRPFWFWLFKFEGNQFVKYIEIDSYLEKDAKVDGRLDSISIKKRYGRTEFLPLFAGRFVESAKASDAVLDDFLK